MADGESWARLAIFVTGLVSGFCLNSLRGASRTEVKRPSKHLAGKAWSYKMVLVVNSQLKMGKGKIAAQCAHAAVGVVEECGNQPKHKYAFDYWSANGQPKIAVQTTELDALRKAAKKSGLPYYLVCDAGKTQIPAGSHTVLAIGPGLIEEVDALTGDLRLL